MSCFLRPVRECMSIININVKKGGIGIDVKAERRFLSDMCVKKNFFNLQKTYISQGLIKICHLLRIEFKIHR